MSIFSSINSIIQKLTDIDFATLKDSISESNREIYEILTEQYCKFDFKRFKNFDTPDRTRTIGNLLYLSGFHFPLFPKLLDEIQFDDIISQYFALFSFLTWICINENFKNDIYSLKIFTF